MRSTLTLVFALLSLAFVGCDSVKKGDFVGRWINKETEVRKNMLTGDKTDIVERTLELNSSGNGELVIRVNGKTENGAKGKWAIQGDIFFLDYEGDQTLYMRIIRITNERMVIRTPEGKERIYDRLQ